MAIKNYTSTVDVYKSLGIIQGVLASHGARKIMVDYSESGKPSGVVFGIQTKDGLACFSLPANVDGVLAVFAKQRVKTDREQAERTAWKNISDWVSAQMALIEAGQVQMDEVFLPYLTNASGKTLYEVYKTGQLALEGGDV